MKIGDPKGKKAISKAFRELEKLGFKVWNFSSNKRLNAGMKDFVDYMVLGRNALHVLELKLEGDKFSDGQLDTMERFLRLELISKRVLYNTIFENNYKDIIDLIVEIG